MEVVAISTVVVMEAVAVAGLAARQCELLPRATIVFDLLAMLLPEVLLFAFTLFAGFLFEGSTPLEVFLGLTLTMLLLLQLHSRAELLFFATSTEFLFLPAFPVLLLFFLPTVLLVLSIPIHLQLGLILSVPTLPTAATSDTLLLLIIVIVLINHVLLLLVVMTVGLFLPIIFFVLLILFLGLRLIAALSPFGDASLLLFAAKFS